MRAELAGRVALVTGASRGIGRAIARELAGRKMKLAVTARSSEALDELCAEIREDGGTAMPFAGDVGDAEFCRDLVGRVESELGPVHVLVNNAGVGVFKKLVETEPAELEAPLRVPVLAALTLSHACLPGMLERGDGFVVNLTSAGGKLVIPNSAAYTAARFGVTGLTHALQEEVRGSGVTAILVCPGEVRTEYFERNRSSPDDLPASKRWFRILTAEEVGRATASAIERRKELVMIPATMAMFIRLYQAFPPLGRWLQRVL